MDTNLIRCTNPMCSVWIFGESAGDNCPLCKGPGAPFLISDATEIKLIFHGI